MGRPIVCGLGCPDQEVPPWCMKEGYLDFVWGFLGLPMSVDLTYCAQLLVILKHRQLGWTGFLMLFSGSHTLLSTLVLCSVVCVP